MSHPQCFQDFKTLIQKFQNWHQKNMENMTVWHKQNMENMTTWHKQNMENMTAWHKKNMIGFGKFLQKARIIYPNESDDHQTITRV